MIRKRFENPLEYAGRTETIVLHVEPEAFDAEMIRDDEKAAKAEAERVRPGLTTLTDRS